MPTNQSHGEVHGPTNQSLSGAGAVNVTTVVTEYTSTGAAQALTLANGTVGQIKEIIHNEDSGHFYIVANKFDEKLGFFIIRFNDNNPNDHKFLTKYKNKLDLGDCNLYVLNHGANYKELVISFKTIYINTYNVTIMDISSEGSDTHTLYRHESFQLWESKV